MKTLKQDKNRKYFEYSIEYYNYLDEICDAGSYRFDTLQEAKMSLEKVLKQMKKDPDILGVKEWWINDQDGDCVAHW